MESSRPGYLLCQDTDYLGTIKGGFCERFHQTVADEFVKIQFRKKIYQSLPELQEDLDQFLEFYNDRRAHLGYGVKGRTPMKAFEGYRDTFREEVKPAA